MKRRTFLTMLGLLPLGVGYEPNGPRRPAWYGLDKTRSGSDRTVYRTVEAWPTPKFAPKAIRR